MKSWARWVGHHNYSLRWAELHLWQRFLHRHKMLAYCVYLFLNIFSLLNTLCSLQIDYVFTVHPIFLQTDYVFTVHPVHPLDWLCVHCTPYMPSDWLCVHRQDRDTHRERHAISRVLHKWMQIRGKVPLIPLAPVCLTSILPNSYREITNVVERM